VALTDYGLIFLRHARALRASYADAIVELRALRAGTAGMVRIGAGPSWHGTLLPRAIDIFRGSRPAVRLAIQHGVDGTLKAQLRRGDLDLVLAAVPEANDDPDLHGEPFIRDDYRIFAHAAHPLRARSLVRPTDLLDWPWILPSPGTLMCERLAAFFRRHGLVMPEPLIETDIVAFKLSLMLEGPYLTCHAGETLLGIGLAELAPLPLESEIGWRAAGVIDRRGVELSPAARALAAAVREVCGDGAVIDAPSREAPKRVRASAAPR
jgi:DNA-binding transcriptional LysR family regulator